MRLYMQNFHLQGQHAFHFVSDSWTTGGVFGYVNFVCYHVGNKRKTCLNRTFCDKGLDAKVGNV